MTDAVVAPDRKLAARELALRWYQARLGFWQAICVTLISAGLAAAIPASVETFKAFQERKLKEAELKLKEKEIEAKHLDTDQQYISKFIDIALNPDVEARIRFSQYFSFVSSTPYREGWEKFLKAVEGRRNTVRQEINAREAELDALRAKQVPLTGAEQTLLAKLQRELSWNYAELGKLEK